MSLIIAGVSSGVGKTTVTLSLLASLRRRGLQTQSFKVGPDYIDPMFHTYVTGRPCRNLDPVITDENYVKECFTYHTQNLDYALVEGVMGLFDGVMGNSKENPSPTPFASTAHISKLLNLPVVLVINCSSLSGSVAAIAHGFNSFDKEIQIAGLVLNRVGSERHLELLKNALEPLHLPLLGILRRHDDITIPDRHLGLVPTEELTELDVLIERLADLGDTCFDWEKLLPLLETAKQVTNCPLTSSYPLLPTPYSLFPKIKIAIARDRAFNFYYQDNLDLLEKLGANLVFWSPLEDKELPSGTRGLYFGGGFPEVFAQKLSSNHHALNAVKTAILSGIPTIAECGGLMYLCDFVVDFESQCWPMVGVLPTNAVMGKRLTLGYRRAIALQDSLLIDAGTTIYGHEFHRSRLAIESHQPLFETYRIDSLESTGNEGWSLLANLHASYIHMHWGTCIEIPQLFLAKILETIDS
ncbi:MAG: cobyrinate a,c-diamide synthase [Calothrix sp. SM1_7_51]|nr:cobyrinate a,c-diamide synthase [Calothrix sp. SM1_7_51]